MMSVAAHVGQLTICGIDTLYSTAAGCDSVHTACRACGYLWGCTGQADLDRQDLQCIYLAHH